MIVQKLDCIPSLLTLNSLMQIRLRHDALTMRGVTARNFPGSLESSAKTLLLCVRVARGHPQAVGGLLENDNTTTP